MTTLRVIGDVHGQIEPDEVIRREARSYLELIAGVPYSVQIGDMGDAETYAQLVAQVDPSRHRFLPGNHEHYEQMPPHSLGDFGSASWGGVDFFFIRGAASDDWNKLTQLGKKLGKKLWYEEEELSDEEMQAAEQAYLQARPTIVLSHDAPTDIARFLWQHICRVGPPNPGARFQPSRTNDFLLRLLLQHAPRLWLFGHHHCDWQYRESETRFVCLGELSYRDITPAGELCDR